jgi:hypothetical protein
MNAENRFFKRQGIHWWPGGLIVLAASVLLFFRLGQYALWDDEAATALHALGVWRTGDTTAILDHNIVATYRGVNLRDLHERLEPPLQSYVAAPFVGLLGATAFAARLPFALVGLIGIVLLLYWGRQRYQEGWQFALLGLAILGNVSLFLYFRQSRYYALAITLTLLLAYVYTHWNGRRNVLLWFSLVSAGLYLANYLNFIAFYVTVFVDYLFWGRHRKKLGVADWLTVIVPQSVVILICASIWNPLGMDARHALPFSNLAERFILLFWNLRDLVLCEFGVGVLLLAAPFVGWWRGNQLLLRGCAAGWVYILIITAISPQPVSMTSVADVRYLVPLIPLFIFLGVETLVALLPTRPVVAVPLGVLAFGTNLLGGALLTGQGVESTWLKYAGELADPPSDPYTVTARWIRDNIRPKESVWVLPDYMTYPLMYHAPDPLYAWQLDWPPREQFKDFAPIYFQGRVPPDYIIAFGPVVQSLLPMLQRWAGNGVRYEFVASIEQFWKDVYRPELIWRSFTGIESFDGNVEAIYIFRRVEPPRKSPSSED